MFPKRLCKTIAVLMLLVFVNSVLTPTITYALTAGPTAPEATSFEPVDTTDLVDLKTGDFTYTVPLLEIPGPAGGYPLALAYHAGIQPDQEASWTGLGFVLNPGSISRLVNGYPDDHNNITNIDRTFWEGGETETYTVGVSVGIANVANVSAGMSFAQDTYKGRGVGGYFGYGADIYKTVSINATMGISPYGDSYSSAGVSVGVSAGSNEGLNASARLGLNINSDGKLNAGVQGGISAGKTSLLGATTSSDQSNVSLSLGGGTAGVYNSKSNKVSINSDNVQVDIPVYYFSIRLGRNYQRYWIDETEVAHTFGSLYMGNVSPNYVSAFDTYDLLDTDLDMADHADAEKVLGGSFPDVDLYTVTGQGISGNIRPYLFQQHLYRQDKRDAADGNKILSKSYKLGENAAAKPVEFRFVNDFSNRLEYDPSDIAANSNGLSFDFDGAVKTGLQGTDGFKNNHLAGSKHVEWYTNQEIMGDAIVHAIDEGFVDCVAEGFERRSDQQVGGYSITNASGVTYHYALPAYSYQEYMKSVNSATKQEQNGLSYNELKKPERYAYTWYLTAVTGPDYVDRNGNGLADKGDWGYWVEFSYKKWLSDYKWRNPGIGENRDIDGDFEFFSAGKKEIYYLDKVVTDSHVAIFEKSERLDGREVSGLISGGFETVARLVQPGRQSCVYECQELYCSQGNCQEPSYGTCQQTCNDLPADVYEYDAPRPTLKLDRIKLYTYDSYINNNLADEYLLRAINFEYDYSLASGTPNSFQANNSQYKLGKLTLKSVKFAGKKGVSLIPPMKFEYKNIPYGRDKTDVWGYYKSDFSTTFRDQTNNIIGRETTASSALDVDAWSLNRVQTSLGSYINIAYESDQYDNVVLSKQQVFRTHNVTDMGNGKLKLTFWEQGLDLDKYFDENQRIDVDLIGSYDKRDHSGKQCNCDQPVPRGYLPQLFSGTVNIVEVNTPGGFIVVQDATYYNHLRNETKVIQTAYNGDGSNCDMAVVTCNVNYSGEKAWPDFFPAGVVSIPQKPRPGGGLRVKSIGMDNTGGDSRTTLYEYAGGTTSYEPFEILAPKILPEYAEFVDPKGTRLYYKKSILKKLYKQIGISRQLPAPGVMYKYVTVRDKTLTADGKEHILPNYTRYEFEMFQEGMVDVIDHDVRKESISAQYDGLNFTNAYHNQKVLKDYTSRVGNLRSITLYNSNDNQPVSKTTNSYLHDGLDGSFAANATTYETDLANDFHNQGVIEETYSRARIMLYRESDKKPYPDPGAQYDFYLNNERNLLATVSKLETYPSVATGQINTNYKTGVTSSTTNVAFDFYSGEATEVLTRDSYGNRYLSVTEPAYLSYPGMGSKVDDKKNRNMLTQTAGSYSYVVNANGEKTGLLSAAVQTWHDQIPVLNAPDALPVWRMQAQYIWNGAMPLNNDGTYPYADFSNHPFNRVSPGNDAHWEKTSELTLYDKYSHGLEASDINGNYAATRMNPNQQRIISSVTNAKYTESASSGAEYYSGNIDLEGGVARGDGTPSTAHAHTGQYSLLVAYNNKGFNYTLSRASADLSRQYRASVWVYAPGISETQPELSKIDLYYTVNGKEQAITHPVLQKSKSKNWYLLSLDIAPQGNEVYIGVRNNSSRGVYFDDFRVHPLDASMTAYVYDRFSGELSYLLDANNFYTKFEYDAMGRLVRTSRELLNFDFGDGKESYRADVIVQEVKYNYGKK